MPEMIVWPVSSSVRTWNVGSSSESDAERLAELVLVDLGLRLDRDRDHRLGELHPLEHDRVARIAERVAGGGLLEAEAGDDVARERDVDVLAVVGVHLQDAADALLAVLGRVVDLGALLELARVDAEVGELATYGSRTILNASAENGSSSVALRSICSSVFASVPWIGGDVDGATAGSRRRRRAWAARPCS